MISPKKPDFIFVFYILLIFLFNLKYNNNIIFITNIILFIYNHIQRGKRSFYDNNARNFHLIIYE